MVKKLLWLKSCICGLKRILHIDIEKGFSGLRGVTAMNIKYFMMRQGVNGFYRENSLFRLPVI